MPAAALLLLLFGAGGAGASPANTPVYSRGCVTPPVSKTNANRYPAIGPVVVLPLVGKRVRWHSTPAEMGFTAEVSSVAEPIAIPKASRLPPRLRRAHLTYFFACELCHFAYAPGAHSPECPPTLYSISVAFGPGSHQVLQDIRAAVAAIEKGWRRRGFELLVEDADSDGVRLIFRGDSHWTLGSSGPGKPGGPDPE